MWLCVCGCGVGCDCGGGSGCYRRVGTLVWRPLARMFSRAAARQTNGLRRHTLCRGPWRSRGPVVIG